MPAVARCQPRPGATRAAASPRASLPRASASRTPALQPSVLGTEEGPLADARGEEARGVLDRPVTKRTGTVVDVHDRRLARRWNGTPVRTSRIRCLWRRL